jgi:polar amino acid transport system substrate-binding protein
MLQSGRVDFWGASRLKGTYLAAQEGISGLKPVLKLKEVSLYLACNKGVPDETVAMLNAVIKQMSEDGTTAGLTKRYLAADK